MDPPYPVDDPSFPLGEEEIITVKPFHYEEHDNFMNSGRIALHMYCHDRKSNSYNVRIDNFRVYSCIELPAFISDKICSPDGDFKKDTFQNSTPITWDFELAQKVFMTLCQKQNKNPDWKTGQSKEPPFDFHFEFYEEIYYYTGRKKPYIYLFFHTLAGRKAMLETIKYHIFVKGEGYMKFEMHENKISTFRRLFSKQNVKYTQWITIKGKKVPFGSKNRINKKSVIEYIADYTTMTQIDQKITADWFVYPKLFSWDGEMYSKNHKQMPGHKRPYDAIYLISVVFQFMEHPETMKKICLIYGDCDDIPGVEVVRFKTEKELLYAFCHLFTYLDPDIIIGYNTTGFDYPYVIGRFDRNNVLLKDIPSTGRLIVDKTEIYEINWSSSGGGKNNIVMFKHRGRFDADMLNIIRRNYKLRQYTLQFASITYLGEGKHDIKAKDMFQIYEDSRAENKGVLVKDVDGKERILTMTDVAAYCVQDSILPIKLFDNRKIWYQLSSLSTSAGVSILELFTRGEQIRCYSNIANECYKQKKVLSNPQYFDYYFKGGFVGKPKPGVYKYVFTLDFASLYPSIMRANNISIDSILKVEDWTKFDPDDYESNCFEQEEPVDYVSHSYRRDLEEKYKILKRQENWIAEYKNFLSSDPQSWRGSYRTSEDYLKIIARHNVKFTADDYTTMSEMGMKDTKRVAINNEKQDEDISYDPDYFEDKNDIGNNGPLYGGKISVTRRYEFRIIKKRIYEGIMSILETDWFFTRKDIKKMMKGCEEKLKINFDAEVESLRSVYDAGQLSQKVMMNSGYGFNGVPTGMLPALPVAILTTAIGRTLIGMVNDMLVENFAHLGAKVVYNDTDSSMISLDINDEDVLSGKVNLEALMREMEEVTNGRKERIVYNDDATVKSIKIEVKIFNDDSTLKETIITYPDISEAKTIADSLINEKYSYHPNGSIKDFMHEEVEQKKVFNEVKKRNDKLITKTTKTVISYNDDATIKEILPEIISKFKKELTMECENCCQMCPLKPKYYIKLHREVNLKKIKRNGFFKKDHDGNFEITTKGILSAKKGNAQFANNVYDTLVKQVIFIEHTANMLYSLSKNICDFLSDRFEVKNLCRVTELGSDYSQESYFMNVFSQYLTSRGMDVKPGDRLEYIVVRTKTEIETGKTENMGSKCREFSMWEADPEREKIDYSYYIEKGLQEQFDYLFSVGSKTVVEDERLAEVGYKPQYSYARDGLLKIGKSTSHFVHFSKPIKMIAALVKDYMKLSDEEFIQIYNSMGREHDPKYPRNFYIAIILDTFIDRICKYIQQYYPLASI